MPARARVGLAVFIAVVTVAALVAAAPGMTTRIAGSDTVAGAACVTPGSGGPGCDVAPAASRMLGFLPSASVSPSGPASRPASPRPSSSTETAAPSDTTTAAGRYGWQNLVGSEDFNGSSLSDSWGAYDGPGSGGQGVRSPRQITVGGGVARISGTTDGTTGGMYWKGSLKYGRWEIRARFPAGCVCYHPVVLLWPASGDWPAGGEVDYAEVFEASRHDLNFFLHYSANDKVLHTVKRLDLTQWHNFAVEWTPDHITGYVDGTPYFHTTQLSALPPDRMFQAIQLDWYPAATKGTGTLEVDWARKYRL